MPSKISVHPETFAAIQNVDIDRLSRLPDGALRPILPCLVRMSLCAPLDTSAKWTLERKKILKCLSGIEVVNSLVGLLSIDFHELEQDARKEQHMRYGACTVAVLVKFRTHKVFTNYVQKFRRNCRQYFASFLSYFLVLN